MRIGGIGSLARQVNQLNVQPIKPRQVYKKVANIEFIRPVKPPYWIAGPDSSGDLKPLEEVPEETTVPIYEKAPSFAKANDAVKTILSVGHQGTPALREYIRNQYIDRIRPQEYDNGWPYESKIAKMTGDIRYLQIFLQKNPYNGKERSKLNVLILKRNKELKLLRRLNYKCFEWVLEKLDLVYKSPAQDYLTPVTRKSSMMKLAEMQCEEIKAKKIEEYKNQLLKKKEKLLKEFAKNPI